MSIPKVIHYCWFGRGELPSLAKKCIASWKKYCPDYKIVCWNEDNFNINQNKYAKEAYEAEKWAFVSDYVRLKVLYEEGGIYLDTDVEIIKPIDPIVENGGYMGFDDAGIVSTGLGFACEKGNGLVGELLKDYDDISFKLSDGTYDITPCPKRNTQTMERLGFDVGVKDQVFMGIHIYPEEYFCPLKYYTGKKKITPNTYSIHHFCASWTSATSKRTMFIKRIIGVKLYEKLYGKFLHKFKWLEW
ncbi:MAG: glycosyl transferase [Clostridia bacterium]|nr:glycosyl transferase [Clostridia bacterium]